MKAKGILIGILMLAGAAWGQTKRFDIQVSYGGWSLAPFRSLVERECERVIKNEFNQLVESVISTDLLSPFLSTIDLSSSGHFFSIAASYRFGESRIAAGVRGDYFDFDVPYTLSVAESISIWGFPLATLDGRGAGAVRLSGIAVTVFGRWSPLLTRRSELSFHAGLMMLPFQGDIGLDLAAVLGTPLGDLEYAGSFDDTFDQIKDLGLDMPAIIFSPSVGVEFRYRFSRDFGAFVDATLAQGSFLSGGLFFVF